MVPVSLGGCIFGVSDAPPSEQLRSGSVERSSRRRSHLSIPSRASFDDSDRVIVDDGRAVYHSRLSELEARLRSVQTAITRLVSSSNECVLDVATAQVCYVRVRRLRHTL